MALLCDEAARLNLPRLKTRIIETDIKRGPSQIFARLPFKHDEAETLKLLFEQNTAVGSRCIDPCPPCDPLTSNGCMGTPGFGANGACSIPEDSRGSNELLLHWRMLGSNADVCTVHTFDRRLFDKKVTEIMKHHKYILHDFANQMINAAGQGLTMNGIEYFLDYVNTNYNQVKLYHTCDNTNTGDPRPLNLPAIRKLITVARCDQYDALVSDLESFNATMALLESAGGNTAGMLMQEMFGMNVVSDGQYMGIPWIISDFVGAEKTSAVFATTAASTTVTVATTDRCWPGFTCLDVGRTISVAGVDWGAGNDATTTIASVVDLNTVVVADVANQTVAAGAGTLASTHAIYAVHFDEEDGFHFRHPEANGSVRRESGFKCLPSVGGLKEIDLGPLQTCPTIERTFIRLYGNFSLENVDALARLSHYSIIC